MDSPTLESSVFPENRLIAYLNHLAENKPGLPYGLPVSVSPSHTITTTDDLVHLTSLIGPHIAVLQLNADIIDDWSDETVRQLTALAKRHSFLIWEAGRVLNSTVDVVGRQKSDTREVRNELIDMIRKRYTKGVVKAASWASLATAWASGVAVDNQEADILIPTLKAAAREAVADSVRTIRTEITANGTNERPSSVHESIPKRDDGGSPQPYLTSDYAAGDSGLGLPPRKASTISLTQTISQHTEDSTESLLDIDTTEQIEVSENEQATSSTPHGNLPPPPILARGLVLLLPAASDTSFTSEYRESCLAAARANPDFVIGFLCSLPWHLVSKTDDLFDPVTPEAEQPLSPYSTDGDAEETLPSFALFSFVSHRMNSLNGKQIDDYYADDDDDNKNQVTSVTVDSPSDPASPLAVKLHSILAQALKFRDAPQRDSNTAQTRRASGSRPRIMHIPVVSLP
ncbi:uncharacterized protein BDW47DRAFT_94971 [Aspergillus candidus]|uniref:Uncharacterized protein n=1 Tax=Aspergillus candidus TaxID=41067 RepID=A0A2I2EYM2_ASPCN|nr:hypothetical protein BDW47DRAFT_94971 [Aspergillus candidus]PLB33477.1 hypothetical protein BDW47DRAFT_94971 [Aspergillus candidus]